MPSSADFALAQERLAARRQAREAFARAAVDAQRASHAHSEALSRLPYPLNTISAASLRTWDSISGRTGTRPAFRVGQVDAELLDEELLSLLKTQVGEGLKYYGSHLQDEWSTEILLVLRAMLWKLSIWDHDASYGASLQGLRYTDARGEARSRGRERPKPTKWQKGLYGLFSVGGRYTWKKWEDWLVEKEGGYEEPTPLVERLSRITQFLTTAHSIGAFVSFLVFLTNGRYRTLLDRFLRLRLTPTSSKLSREVSFEYLNRQLVWHAFTEFLLFLLPLVGISRWRRILSRTWRKIRRFIFNRKKADDDDEDVRKGGELGFLPERTCAICYSGQNPTTVSETSILAASAGGGGVIGSAQTDITNPYEAIPCGDLYCFACIAQKIEAEEGEGWTCLRCGDIVKECKPWHGDVVEEVERPPSNGKSVGFADEKTESDTPEMRDVEPIPEPDDATLEVNKSVLRRVEAETPAGKTMEESEWSRADPSDSDEQSEEYDEEEEELADFEAAQ
ncbi:peroxisomal biogenesis factor 2 [Patellaria atrata CBS 101060]|uniref:RING-type E3 ubiquitin transferase (cysteine targeting) n=1 Tax=Patellaria atrata CBS 101060 TaxID=1346257 RepID=A0A9P4VRJ9_9PEZI|nr:peroxisomal biogenesis factor 2 [Patellaria atrata CBS 101060]